MLRLYDLTPAIFVLSIVSIVLCTTFTGLRVAVRHHHRNLGIDDYVAVIGLVFWLVCLGLAITLCINGLGARWPNYTDAMRLRTQRFFVIFQDIYVWANIPIKVSVCLSINRFMRHYTWISWTLYFMIFVITSSSIVTNIWLLTFCKPIAKLWDPTITYGTCRPAQAMVSISNAWSYINIIVDWVVALLPVFVLWKANMPWGQKITVAGVLSLGIFASTATIVRLVYLPYFTATEDYLYGLGFIILWTILELTLAIVAVSLIALRPLFRRFFGMGASDVNARAAVGDRPTTRQLENRFFRMHGWSLPFGLDSYINTTSTRPMIGPTERSNAQGSVGDLECSQPSRCVSE